jgi:hypothetical protein
MDILNSIISILKSPTANHEYKQHTRESAVHLAHKGNQELQRILNYQPKGECPCSGCIRQRRIDQELPNETETS